MGQMIGNEVLIIDPGNRKFYNIDSVRFMALNDTIFAMGGLGEIISMKARVPDEVTLQYAGKDFWIDHPYVQMEYEKVSRHLYGSNGKDFMYLYPKRTMSFKLARLEFE